VGLKAVFDIASDTAFFIGEGDFAADIKKPGARGTGTGKARHSPEKTGGRRICSGLAMHLKRRGFRCEKG